MDKRDGIVGGLGRPVSVLRWECFRRFDLRYCVITRLFGQRRPHNPASTDGRRLCGADRPRLTRAPSRGAALRLRPRLLLQPRRGSQSVRATRCTARPPGGRFQRARISQYQSGYRRCGRSPCPRGPRAQGTLHAVLPIPQARPFYSCNRQKDGRVMLRRRIGWIRGAD
jgi:hypothetical protein